MTNTFAVDAMLDDRSTRIIVCCGSGGVGKTTTSAALALRAADRGRHAVVLTIDPARRLAQSLGLADLTNEPQPVATPGASGSLSALMLDMKKTFDDIVRANAEPDRAEQILELRAGKGHRLDRPVVHRSIGANQEYAGLTEQRRFLDPDRCLAARGRDVETPFARLGQRQVIAEA